MIRQPWRGSPDPEPPPSQSKGAILRARFDQYAERFPVGETAEPHARLQAAPLAPGRRPLPRPHDRGPTETTYPILTAECDVCQFEAAYPIRALHVLGPALRAAPAVPADQPF